MLSLFYLVLLITAGSNAAPCPDANPNTEEKVSLENLGPAQILQGFSSASVAGQASQTASAASGSITGGASSSGLGSSAPNSGLVLPLPYSNSSSTSSGASTGSSASTSNGASSGGGKCPAGFLNTVFNTVAPENSGWPSKTWASLVANGVSNWIGFSLETLDQQKTYNTGGGAAQVTPVLNEGQINVVMDPTYTDAAVRMLSGPNPPPYLELFNEPDFSFEGFTPLTDPAPAASNLQKLFAAPHPNTKYISPALMDANGPWLPQFNASCNGCFDQIDIIAMHVYNPDPSGVMGQITQLHSTWPTKRIWITELSPATTGCSMDASGIAGYINTLIPQIIALGYVDKIFWNSGENDTPAINNAPSSCNPSLTNADGSATSILNAYGAACGFTSGGTATS